MNTENKPGEIPENGHDASDIDPWQSPKEREKILRAREEDIEAAAAAEEEERERHEAARHEIEEEARKEAEEAFREVYPEDIDE